MNIRLLQEYVSLIMEKIRTQKGQKGIMGEKFNLQKFESLPDTRTMRAYASKFLEKLGTGSSRVSFLLSSKYVLKIALNQKGLSQNQAEFETYSSSKSPLVAKVYRSDEHKQWLISDLVKELNDENEFESLTNVAWDDFDRRVYDHLGKKSTGKQQLDPFSKKVVEFCKEQDLLVGDIVNITHWGKTPDGRIVLLDYGLTPEVWEKHYAGVRGNDSENIENPNADAQTFKPGSDQEQKTSKPGRNVPDVKTGREGKPRQKDDELEKSAGQNNNAKNGGGTKPSRYAPEDTEKTKR